MFNFDNPLFLITWPGIGSIRPVTGEEQSLVRVKVRLAWDKMERSLDTEVLDTMETKNSTFREQDDNLCIFSYHCVKLREGALLLNASLLISKYWNVIALLTVMSTWTGAASKMSRPV